MHETWVGMVIGLIILLLVINILVLEQRAERAEKKNWRLEKDVRFLEAVIEMERSKEDERE